MHSSAPLRVLCVSAVKNPTERPTIPCNITEDPNVFYRLGKKPQFRHESPVPR